MNIREELDNLRESLLQQRDELIVKAGLAKLEAREEWENVEKQVDHFMAKLETIGNEASAASEDVLKSARNLGEEIKKAYERIVKQL